MYISVSLATCLRFSRVGQFSCFRALVTHPSFSVSVLVTKCAALRWTCLRATISDMLYVNPIQYNHILTLVSLAICGLDL